MSLVCAQCSRVNPSEAAYCYHDGAALAGRAGGPINTGAAPFPHPFVFPNGLSCRNFDQLASACQQDWSAAMDLLKQGFLGSFFGGMGRLDLLGAAQEAAKFPDMERGLDQLLAKLPTQALQPPKLQAEPTEVNLGQLKVGDDRATELHLTNLGMRLLYGNVTTDCKWLTLGDAPGHPEKLFQFGIETVIPVQVRGQHLRAGSKPLEGHLTIDSNGGTMTVTFRADVPITPYGGGLFNSAVTPRQVAEKAKAQPKDAAPYFESGDVAKWYATNGWAYPVVGPTMPGMGGIQQFFEALGVAKPPKVDFNPKSLELEGGVGKTVETKIEVSTTEKKVVYGWATSDQGWIEVGTTKLLGKTAVIPISVKIPKPCPPTLETTLHIFGNGSQKLDVPLKVKVVGGKSGVKLKEEVVYDSLEFVEDEAPLSVQVLEEERPVPVMTIPEPAPLTVSGAGDGPSTIDLGPTPHATNAPPSAAFAPGPPDVEESPFALDGPAPAPSTNVKAGPPPTSAPPKGGMPLPVRLVIHLAPVAALFLCLLTPCLHDVFFAGKGQTQGGGTDGDDAVDPRPFVKIVFDEGARDKDYKDSMTFAVHKIDPHDKNAPSVKLNYYDNGFGNSTVVRIDTKDAVFGIVPEGGIWAKDSRNGGIPAGKYPPNSPAGKSRTFEFGKGISVTQTVTLEPSEAVEVGGEPKRLLTMCLARYRIHNFDKITHKVGMRVLMDTCIGDNDGVPFLLPGVTELVDTSKDFRGRDVPDFVQVLEKPDLKDPGVILQLNLRVGDVGKTRLDPPDRFVLTMYPGRIQNEHYKWDVPVKSFKEAKDSCVVMYWDPRDVGAGKTREVGFTYGLGNVSAEAGKIAVTVGGNFRVNGELTVVALINDRDAKTATLDMPKGWTLIEPKTATQPIPPSRSERPSPVTWRVQAGAEGRHSITVTTDNKLSQSRRIKITDKSLFN